MYYYVIILIASTCVYSVPVYAGNLTADAVLPAIADTGSANDTMIYELEFKDALLLDVIRVLAEQSGTNIIASEEANNKRVTIYLKNVSVKEAVESICRINGLWYRQDGNNQTFRIMTVEQFQKDITVYKNERVRVFKLLNPNVRIVAQAIEDLYGQRVVLSLGLDPAQEQEFVTSGGGSAFGAGVGGSSFSSGRRSGSNNTRSNRSSSIGGGRGGAGGRSDSFVDEGRQVQTELSVDQIEALSSPNARIDAAMLQELTAQSSLIYVTTNNEHNQVIVRTSDEQALESIESLISQMDKPVPQVLLEMKVLDIRLAEDFRSSGSLSTEVGTSDVPDPASSDFFPSSSFLFGNFPLEGGTFIYQFISEKVLATLEILAQNDRVNVLSKPVILASNNRPAELFVGEEAIITTGVSSDIVTNQTITNTFLTAETEVRQVGNRITITPFINEDDSITLALQQETSTVNQNGGSVIVQTGVGGVTEVPIDTVNTALLNGTVVAKHGYTMAVGGLIRNTKSNNVQKVPVLGDIPVLGTLFRRQEQIEDERELVLLITPYVMRKGDEYENVTRERILKESKYSDWKEDEVIPGFIKPRQVPPGTIKEDLRIYEKNSIRPGSRLDSSESFEWRTIKAPNIHKQGETGSLPDTSARVDNNPAINLIKAAAMEKQPIDAVQVPVQASIPAPLFVERKLVAYPQFTWKQDDLYVSRVTVKNISKMPIAITPSDLRGNWAMASFDKESLDPGEETTGYLVSTQQFVDSIASMPANWQVRQVVVQ